MHGNIQWSSNDHDHADVPVCLPVAGANEGNSRKRSNADDPYDNVKIPKIEIVDMKIEGAMEYEWIDNDSADNTKNNDVNSTNYKTIYSTNHHSINTTNNGNINSSEANKSPRKKNPSILYNLAESLAECINSNKSLTFKPLLKNYQVALVKENVIQVDWKSVSNGNRKYYGIFHQNFVQNIGLSDSAQKLKYLLLKSLQGNPDLNKIELKLNDTFGQTFKFDKDPQIKKVSKLCNVLASSIKKSLKTPDESITIQRRSSIKENIQKLAGHVLKKDRNCVIFTENFLNTEKQLAGNINLLRDNIIDMLRDDKYYNFKDLKKCRFKIHCFTDLESPNVPMELPKDLIEDSTAIMKTNSTMEKIPNINTDQKYTMEKIQNINIEQKHAVEKIQTINAEQKHVRKKIQNINTEQKHNIEKVPNTNTEQKYCNYLDNWNNHFPKMKIEFNRAALNTITSSINNTLCKPVILISTKSSEYCIQKVRQVIKNIPIYSKANGYLIIKFNDFLNKKRDILKAFESVSTQLLVIEYSRENNKIEDMSKKCSELEDIVSKASKNNPKKIVVIGDAKDFRKSFKLKYITIDDNYNNISSQLTEESKLNLLQTREVKLYNRKLRFAELMDKHTFENLITPGLLKQILFSEPAIAFDKPQNYFYKFDLKHDGNLIGSRKIVIVSGISGMGKGTYLRNKQDELIKFFKNDQIWIVSIHLNRIEVIKKLKNKIFETSEEAINFLPELLDFKGFQKHMFVACASGKLNLKLILLFYGFEERLIHPSNDSKEAVTTLIKALRLADSFANIYLTCDIKSRKELEQDLNVPAYELQYNFTPEKKLDFMIECLHCRPDNDTVKLRQRAKHLLMGYEKQRRLEMNTPLKLKMLVYLHQSELMRGDPLPTYSKATVSIYKFYLDFVEFCKIDSDTSEKLRKFSLKRLLTSSELKSLKLDDETRLLSEDVFQNQNNLLRHITFAELFVAKWLSKNIKNKEIESSINKCIERLILIASGVFFHTFATYFRLYHAKEFELHLQTIFQKDFVNRWKAIIDRRFFVLHEQELLRQAVMNNKPEMVKILLDFHRDRSEHSKLSELVNSKSSIEAGGKNALTLAAETENVRIACELIVAGAKIEELTLKEFEKKILRFIFDKFFKAQSTDKDKYILILIKYVQLKRDVVIESLEPKKIEELLSFFLDNDYIQTTICLLHLLHDKSLGEKLIDNCFVIINTNNKIKDDDRLEISKFLLNEFGASLKNGIVRILNAAVYSKHPRCLAYFVNQYPEDCIRFLNHVLLKNFQKPLMFLLSSHDTFSNRSIISVDVALNVAMSLRNVNPRILKILIDEANKSKVEIPLFTALEKTADQQVVRYLVEKGGDLNARDKNGMFPWCYVLLHKDTRYSIQDQSELMKYFKSKTKLKVPSKEAGADYGERFDDRTREIAKKLEFFQNKNYDLNKIDGSTPRLHEAIEKNNIDWLSFLLCHGADPNIRERRLRETALHRAVKSGNYDMVLLLLKHGAMFDAANDDKKMPIDFASPHGKIEHLLKKIDSYFYGQNLGATLENNLTSTVELPERFIFNCRNRRKETLLHVAASANDFSAVTELLTFSKMCKNRYPDQPSLDVNSRDCIRDAPIHVACRKGYVSIVSALLMSGAVFEDKDIKESNLYKLAIQSNCIRTICLFDLIKMLFNALQTKNRKEAKLCIELCPRITNAKSYYKLPVLHWIVWNNDDDLLMYFMKKLMKNNEYLPAVDLSGGTELHIAAEVDNLPAARLLLQFGFSIDIANKQDKRAFEYGPPSSKCAQMLRDIYELFEDLRSDSPKILLDEHPEYLEKYLKNLKKLYEIEPYVVMNTKFGPQQRNTLAQQAAYYNYRTVLENLFRHGAGLFYDKVPVNTVSKKFLDKVENVLFTMSVDDWIASNLDEKIIVNCRDLNGETLLFKAVRETKSREVRWLLKQGANPLDTTVDNMSPLSLAKKMANSEILDFVNEAAAPLLENAVLKRIYENMLL